MAYLFTFEDAWCVGVSLPVLPHLLRPHVGCPLPVTAARARVCVCVCVVFLEGGTMVGLTYSLFRFMKKLADR